VSLEIDYVPEAGLYPGDEKRPAKSRGLGKRLDVLIIEDNSDDLELILGILRHSGYYPRYKYVDNARSLSEALRQQAWQIVLSDFRLPQFSGAEALRIIRDSFGLDVPVIFVSGAIGEETAVELMRTGAQDYVLKDKLVRLPLAIERELHAAETRRQQKESEEQLALEREKFVSIIAHDLRAPVQRVEAMAQLLRSEYPEIDDGGKDIITRIERAAARIRLMLVSLLDYSRFSRGAIDGKTTALAAVIDDALENIGIDHALVDLRIDLNGIGHVKGDAVLLGHVIQNLVGNAIKFRRPDARLAVTIDARAVDDNRVEVSVTDNGVGIEPRFADQVFEMFYRLHNDDEYQGTGIGLAICKKIINDHGGKIWIDTAFSGGTRVVFTLLAA
jgi:signal transduction histidine kinase